MLVANRSAHPLDMDQAVAEAWGQPAWGDYSGVATTFSADDNWLGDNPIGNDSADSIRIEIRPFCDMVTEIPKAECEALVALYNHLRPVLDQPNRLAGELRRMLVVRRLMLLPSGRLGRTCNRARPARQQPDRQPLGQSGQLLRFAGPRTQRK